MQQPEISIHPLIGRLRLIRNFWKFAKNGRKKSSKSFSDLLLCVPLQGGEIFSFYVIGQAGT